MNTALQAALSGHYAAITSDASGRASAPCVDQADFRAAMATLPTGVSLLTTAHPAGIWGMTIGSLTSLSLDPPLLLVCLHRASITLDLLAADGLFAVNVLSSTQSVLADTFARPRDHTAATAGAFDDVDDVPVLTDAVAWLTCRHEHTYTSGDHAIVIGAVLRTQHTRREPLIRHGSSYRQLQ